MPKRTTTRATVTLVAAATAAAVLGVAPAALAVATPHTCVDASTSTALTGSGAAAQKAAIDRCIAGLATQSAAAGRAAQVADERYLRARVTAATAKVNAQRAEDRATVAERQAQASRDRSAAVTAYLARTGQGDQATSVMLDGKSAAKTLYALSRVTQLTVDAAQIAQQATDDSAAATLAGQQSAQASAQASAESTAASVAFDTAKRLADQSALLVSQQISQEQALEQQLGMRAATGLHPVLTDLPADASVADKVVAFARAQIGDPYVFAAAGPSTWDCSGLTMGAYAAAGIGIGGHSATAQYDLAASTGRLVPYAEAQAGDLVFYTDGGGDMYHVAVYSGDGMMIEAPQEGEDVHEVAVRTQDLVDVVARPSA